MTPSLTTCAALRGENMVVVRCLVLALCSIATAACADPREGRTTPGARRRQRADFGSDAERRRSVSTRSAGVNEQTCPASPGVDATLREDTHSVSGRSRLLLLLQLLLLLLLLFIRSQQLSKVPQEESDVTQWSLRCGHMEQLSMCPL